MSDLKTRVEIAVEKTGTGAQQVTKELGDLKAQAAAVTESVEKLKAAVVGAFIGNEIASFVKESVAAFAESEESANRLAGVLRARGKYTTEYADQLKALSESLRDVTVNGDEAILNVEAQLISFGATKDEIKTLTEAVLDLSSGLRVDLATAANMVGRAITGEVGIFSRYGFSIDEAASNAKKLESVLGQIQTRFGGLARGDTETFTGQLKMLKEAWGDFKEDIGSTIVPALIPVLKQLRDLIKELKVPDGPKTSGISSYNDAQSKLDAERLDKLLQAELKIEKSVERQRQIRAALKELIASQADQGIREGRMLKDDEFDAARLRRASAVTAGVQLLQRRPEAVAAPEVTAPSPEQLKAVSDLARLQAKMEIDILDGYEKERAVIDANFEERKAQIEKLTELGKVDADTRDRMIVINNQVRDSENAIVQAKEEQVEQQKRLAWQAEHLRAMEEADATRKQELNAELADFERNLQITTTYSADKRMVQAKREYEVRISLYQDLVAQGKMTEEELVEFRKEASYKIQEAAAQEHAEVVKKLREQSEEYKRLGESIKTNFAGSMSHAIVTMVTDWKNAGAAFKEFASSFLKQVAEMILQLLILRALRAAFGFAGGGTSTVGESGQSAFPAANGGVFPRMMASGGVNGAFDLDSATYFPRHNVVAGEAGRETLAVLSKPRSTNFGGVPAVSGRAGSSDVSLVSTAGLSALAGGSGGRIMIDISLDQSLRAEIANQAADIAVTRIDQRLTEDSQTSRRVRSLARA